MPTQQHQHHASHGGVLEQKWSKPVVDAGWVGIPRLLLKFGWELGLDAIDQMIIINISDHWWAVDSKAFPAKKTIARRLGVDPRTVQRRIQQMESRGLMRREQRRRASGGGDTNIYHLDGLRWALEGLAQRSQRSRQKAARVASHDLPVAEQPVGFGVPGGSIRRTAAWERPVDGDDDDEETQDYSAGGDDDEGAEDYSPRDDDDDT